MNPLERLMYVSGDKPPKKLPTRQPMWNQGYTEPSVNTATPSIYSTGLGLPNVKKEVVIRPKPKDSSAYMPYNPSRDTWGEVAKFGTSMLADPIALGMSAYDFAQDPSWLNAGALGLDAFTPGNVGGFLKGIGEIGIAGAAAREFAKKGVGRVVTNLVEPMGYSNKISELKFRARREGIMPFLNSIKNDVPIYGADEFIAQREFPYRTMFGLQPRTINKYRLTDGNMVYDDLTDNYFQTEGYGPTQYFYDDIRGIDNTYGGELEKVGTQPLPTRSADGTYIPNKDGMAYEELGSLPVSRHYPFKDIDLTKDAHINNLENSLFAGYHADWDAANRVLTANDRWDFDLHPGEMKKALKSLFEKDGIDMKMKWRQNVVPTALRFAMSKITDPITYKVPIKLDDMAPWTKSTMEQMIGNQYLEKWGRKPIPYNTQFDADELLY